MNFTSYLIIKRGLKIKFSLLSYRKYRTNKCLKVSIRLNNSQKNIFITQIGNRKRLSHYFSIVIRFNKKSKLIYLYLFISLSIYTIYLIRSVYNAIKIHLKGL